MQFYSKVAGLYVSCNLTEYWLIFNYFAITDFAKIISSLSESKTNQFQGTPLNGCFWNNSFTRVVKRWKWLQNVSVAAVRGCFYKKLSEKITECSGMKCLWGSLSLVKLYTVHLKKNFSLYFFLENFEKCP